MLAFTIRYFNKIGLFFLPFALGLVNISIAKAEIQSARQLPTNTDNYSIAQTSSNNNTNTSENSNPTQSDILLSLKGGQKLMAEADRAINSQQYDIAVDKLQKARQIFNQLSNFYLELTSSFSGIDNSIAEDQRLKALETGQMRDQATYQLALVHRAQNQPELSVPLLVQVIRSQNPTSELGKKSYQQLLEIGFVDVPFNNTKPGRSSNGNANNDNVGSDNSTPTNSGSGENNNPNQ